MGDDDTPRQMPTQRAVTLDVLAERLSNFQDDFREHRKDFKKFVSKQQEQESDHVLAIERCSTHGTRLDAVEKKLAEPVAEPVAASADRATFWTSIAALGAGIGAWLSHLFGSVPPHVFIVGTVLLTGCGSTRDTTVAATTHTVQVVDTLAPTPAGTLALASRVITTTDTRQDSTEHRESQVDVMPPAPIMAALAPAAGGPLGLLSGIAGMALSAATGIYAAHQSAKAKAATVRADEHKEDAAEGWNKAQEFALLVPPKAAE